MLTPLDIHNREFKKTLRGYDVDEVDEFLDEVIKDFESLYKENLEHKEQLQKQQENIGRYREMEETLQNTMVLAQKMAEDARRNAEKEAEIIEREAKSKAEQIVSSAHEQVNEDFKKLERLRLYEKQLKAKLKGFLSAQMQMVETEEWYGVPAEDEKGEEKAADKREYTRNAFMEDHGDE